MPKHVARFVAVIGFLAPLVAACSIFSSPDPTPTPRPTALPPGYTVSGKTMGDPNAKVTLVEFADFQ